MSQNKWFNVDTTHKGRRDSHGGVPSVGVRNVGSYQVSGTPWITGSDEIDNGHVHMVAFPKVSKSFTVINTNSDSAEELRVHFQSGSAAITLPGESGAQTIAAASGVLQGFHYITIPGGHASMTFDTKCAKFYISNGSGTNNLAYQVLAELTNIPTGSMWNLTGSGITDSDDDHA